MFTACCLFFISPSFSFWTYPRMSCDELIKIHRIFFVCMRFSRYVDDNESKWKPHASHYFRLSAQETSFLSLTDILRISSPPDESKLMHASMQRFPSSAGSAARLIIKWRWRDSNSWPPACKAGALPTELHPHWVIGFIQFTISLTNC